MSTPEERGRDSDKRNALIRRWECVHFRSPANDRDLRESLNSAASNGIRVLEFYIGDLVGKNVLLYEIAHKLDWQGMFGYSPQPDWGNWDAFLSGLCELDVIHPDASGYMFVLHGARRWWRDEPMTVGELIEVWRAAAGRRFDYSDRLFDLVFLV